MKAIDRILRTMVTGAYQLLRAGWFVRRPRTFGAHALALTPDRKLILVNPSERIQRLLKLAKLDAVFKIYNSEEEAIAAESGSSAAHA